PFLLSPFALVARCEGARPTARARSIQDSGLRACGAIWLRTRATSGESFGWAAAARQRVDVRVPHRVQRTILQTCAKDQWVDGVRRRHPGAVYADIVASKGKAPHCLAVRFSCRI